VVLVQAEGRSHGDDLEKDSYSGWPAQLQRIRLHPNRSIGTRENIVSQPQPALVRQRGSTEKASTCYSGGSVSGPGRSKSMDILWHGRYTGSFGRRVCGLNDCVSNTCQKPFHGRNEHLLTCSMTRLMGQDGIYLQVIATSGEGQEQKHAQKVYGLLKRGKHWVLVTLLLSNVIVNETLPIVLDRSLGGGWPAVLGSTVLIGKLYTLVMLGSFADLYSHLW
jgi:hypothetical protein